MTHGARPSSFRGARCAILPLALAAGCGRLRFDALTDAGGDGTRADGADGAPGDVAPLGPFGTPVPHPEISDPTGTDDPTLTADLLEIFYARGAGAAGDIWTATRAAVTDPFGTPSPVNELNSLGNENTPSVSDDGLTIWFSSDRAGGLGQTDIWMATRASRGALWSVPTHVAELSSTLQDVGMQVTSDGLHAVLNRDPVTQSIWDLYLSSRPTLADVWGTPAPISELNTPAARESDGWLSPDLLVLWFASDAPGTSGMRDLWMASRATPTAPFGTPTPVPEVSSTVDDVDPWLSPDQRTLFFASSRGGILEIYEARR